MVPTFPEFNKDLLEERLITMWNINRNVECQKNHHTIDNGNLECVKELTTRP